MSALNVTGGAVTLHNTILANTQKPFWRTSARLPGRPRDDHLAWLQPDQPGGRLRDLSSRFQIPAGDQIGTLAKPIDPMLGVLKNNGGSTYTRGLLPGSPAVDKADPLNSFKTDQRVYQRPVGKADIGAYERGAVK